MSTYLPLVLVVDDNSRNLQVIGSCLHDQGYELAFMESALGLKDWVLAEQPTLILLDIMMPDIDGLSVCRSLKADSRTSGIPLVFITARGSSDDVIAGFDAGAVDYITKPFNPRELRARVKSHVELQQIRNHYAHTVEALNLANREITQQNARLASLTRELEKQASNDLLTGALNRRSFNAILSAELARTHRGTTNLSLVMFDIDFFKKINDTWGHEAGDKALVHVVRTITDQVRKQDQFARWGGEEFLLLLPDTGLEGALVIAGKIVAAVQDHPLAIPGFDGRTNMVSITITAGVASSGQGSSSDELVRQADRMLYVAKAAGRNCVRPERT